MKVLNKFAIIFIEYNKEILREERIKLKKKRRDNLFLYEVNYKDHLDKEIEVKVMNEMEIKNKELQIKYRKLLENEKKSFEAKIKEKYDTAISKEINKLDIEKSEFARQKSGYSVMIHKLDVQKKQYFNKLNEKQQRLIKKELDLKHSQKNFDENLFSNNNKSGSFLEYQTTQIEESSKVFRSPLILNSNSSEKRPQTFLPFSKALVNKAINDIGIDQMLEKITLSPNILQKSKKNYENL